MRWAKYTAATTELVMIFPAVLFMTSLFVRQIQPQQYEPAHTAERIVLWYSARPHLGLWIALIGLPLTVLISGVRILCKRWKCEAALREAAAHSLRMMREHLATILTAAATAAAGGILAIVALHLIAD
jgi:hypothetical protein